MLYHGENPISEIIGVEHLRWNGGTFEVAPRKHAALAFRISGTATIGSGGREYFINTNDVLYLPQNIGYTAQYTDTEMIAIHFLTAQEDPRPEVYSFQNGEQLYRLFLQALDCWREKAPGHRVYTVSLLYAILGAINEQETAAGLPPPFLKAVSFINAHYKSNTLSAGQICKEAGIGATAFRRLFRQHYQKTPVEYITDLRLEHARRLIAGGMPIEQAAYESGFNDPKYFARVVRRRFGCTPRALKTYGK